MQGISALGKNGADPCWGSWSGLNLTSSDAGIFPIVLFEMALSVLKPINSFPASFPNLSVFTQS